MMFKVPSNPNHSMILRKSSTTEQQRAFVVCVFSLNTAASHYSLVLLL